MDDNLLTFTADFIHKSIPAWPCPVCEVGSLSLSKDDQFKKKYKIPLDTNHPNPGPELTEYVFSMSLKCTSHSCGCQVVCAGTGDMS